jgi:glycosyltransferase involved in cell wall biosynthesis
MQVSRLDRQLLCTTAMAGTVAIRGGPRNRILYVTHASPVPAKLGPARRHYHMLGQLCRFYNVHVLSLGNSGEAEAFGAEMRGRVAGFTYAHGAEARPARVARKLARTIAGQCDFLPVIEPRLRTCCVELTQAQPFSGIFLSTVLLRGLPLPDGVPIIGDTHNVEFDVLRRMAEAGDGFLIRSYAARQWRATRREEQRCANRVDLLLATSDRDRHVFESELGVHGVEVVPNGVDLKEFSPAPSTCGANTVMFSGLMSYYPNQQAIRWFLQAVFPSVRQAVPSAKLIVAGAAPPRWLVNLADDSLEVTGRVDDMRPYLRRAAVVVVPLLIGGGTRVKILEAQAIGRPVVSTTVGAEGLGLQHGDSVLFADDAKSFAARVIDVLTDGRLAADLATRGRQHVVRHFDWDRIGDRLGCLLHQRLGIVPSAPENGPTAQAVGA